MEANGQFHAPAAFPLEKKPRYTLDKTLAGPQTQPESCAQDINFSLNGNGRRKVTALLITELLSRKIWSLRRKLWIEISWKAYKVKAEEDKIWSEDDWSDWTDSVRTTHKCPAPLSRRSAPRTHWYFGHVAWPFPFSLRVIQLLRKRA